MAEAASPTKTGVTQQRVNAHLRRRVKRSPAPIATPSPEDPPGVSAWSVSDLGRLIADLSRQHNDADRQGIEASDSSPHEKRRAGDMMRFTDDGVTALTAAAFVLPGRTLADAATHGLLALGEINGLINEMEDHERDSAYRKLRRALVSMVQVIATEAGIEEAALEAEETGWRLYCDQAFPAGRDEA